MPIKTFYSLADISPNNSYATPRKYIRRGGIRGGIRGSGSIRKRGGVTRNRPRCIGGLLHTPDKTKDSPLFSPVRCHVFNSIQN